MKKVKLILIGAGDRGTTYVDLGADTCPAKKYDVFAFIDPLSK